MSKTILVVDDDDLICQLVTRYLEEGNYGVITASDGPTAVEKYEHEKPDLIVLDIAMPEMSGFEVAKRVRAIQQRENRPHTPIILLTAYARSFFLSAGSEADSFLTKPITPEQLRDHITRFLDEATSPSSGAGAAP
ncbi:MAG TPA: response regulator [Aggregatilineaceae bacterium]|nr:response regulator [Aggregatilineaceae bacterium]